MNGDSNTKDKPCPDCGKFIQRRSKQCRSCATKKQAHPTINGKWSKKYDDCIVCGNHNHYYMGNGMCWKCYNKNKTCIDCGAKISLWATRCKRCCHLKRNLTPEARLNHLNNTPKGEKHWAYGLYGDKHPVWSGGGSYEPYTEDFTERFKNFIRERDNNCCIICNKTAEDHGKNLYVHHIDYKKANTFPQNCVSLCNTCHSITNFNRSHWKTFLQALLKERYGYEYTQDQKLILDFTEVSP